MNEQNKPEFLVCVSCMTFNHAPYIVDAMNGFTMQETNFPFVCAIVDDASIDGEQEVIKNYLSENFDLENKKVVRQVETDDYVLTFARHKTNQNCFFAVFYLKYNHYSIKKPKVSYISQWLDNAKYIALCEGDDYWTVPEKLQKQVDFLENHDDYAMCFHRAEIKKNIDVNVSLRCDDIEDKEYSPNEVLKSWKIPTASIMYRSVVSRVKNFGQERILNGDIVLVLNCVKIGKIRGMNKSMSVYRVHENGVTYDKNRKAMRVMRYPDHYLFIKDNYPFLSKTLVNRLVSYAYFKRRNYQPSLLLKLRDILFAIRYWPFIVFVMLRNSVKTVIKFLIRDMNA